MTLDELKLRHNALLAARYSGTRSVSYDSKTVNYGTDAELAAAIGDVERRVASGPWIWRPSKGPDRPAQMDLFEGLQP